MRTYDLTDETDEYPQPRPPRHGPKRDVIKEWATWIIRLMIPAICTLALRQQQAMNDLQMTVAKMSVEQEYETEQRKALADQIERLWRRGSNP